MDVEERNGRRRPATNKRIYPDRPGWTLSLGRHRNAFHVGYSTNEAKLCACGNHPVFEQYAMDIGEDGLRNVPAKQFVAICPFCERRISGNGDLTYCLTAWNVGAMSQDSIAVNSRIKLLDSDACMLLTGKIIKDAQREAVMLIRRRWAIDRQLNDPSCGDWKRERLYTELKEIMQTLRKENELFYGPVAMTRDGDALISTVRKMLYPELTHSERVKIPLRLERMKEWKDSKE